ncbi:AMP-binding protein [Aureisphaera galaxeae]|uniref:AMP-binding protein n=1 Tax=Aureisphaera galaxeae TaxID=1538023 RepID=UPI00235066E1|nr:AMP-binding protein [Aureisphaera galaxeae]MDC8004876.1 AMP-binding protein [Aureisphaera galaxeae]
MPTSPHIHPKFKFNGLSYSSAEELLNFADDLKNHGAAYEVSIANFLEEWLDFGETVMVRTSGSTGTPKEIFLNKQQMINSAEATGAYFKIGEGTKALLCLSADYIAGKMMLVRALVLGWDLHAVAPNKDALTEYDNDYDFVAMVPFQLHHSIHALDKVKKMIVGGGAISVELEAQLQDKTTEVFATYGMTETITHIAVRRINGFAKSDAFSALPNVKFAKDPRGCLVIEAPKVSDDEVVTNDLVTLHSPVSFTWLGRIDNVINSGGVKLSPEKIEMKLSQHFDFSFIIASETDEALGQRVILIVEGKDVPSEEVYGKAFESLEKYERPKRIYSLSKFPYTETGKIKRLDVLSLLHKHN